MQLPKDAVHVDRRTGEKNLAAENVNAPLPPPPPAASKELYGDKGWPDWESAKQGSVNSCWFCSSVIAIAKDDPKRIQDMITDNKNGSYTVKFPQVDRAITVRPPNASEGFGTSNGAWLPVLEKAYGTYLADTGPQKEIPAPNANPKAVFEPEQPKFGKKMAQTKGVEYPKYYGPAQTPAQAMDGPKNFSYDVGTPWGGLSPFYPMSERKDALIIPPGKAGRALGPITQSNVGNYMEWGIANNAPVTAGTFTDDFGGVSNKNLHAGHVYSVINFQKNAGNYGSSNVELRDPYGARVNLTLEDFTRNFGVVAAANKPGLSGERKDTVGGYYRSILGREGDLSERAHHARSAFTLPELRKNIAGSPEGQAQIARLYGELLGHPPDPQGLRTWTDYLANGGDLAGLREKIRGSPELMQKNR